MVYHLISNLCLPYRAALAKMKAAGASLTAQAEAIRSAPLPLLSRFVLVLMALLYAAYAWQVEEVRDYLGLPHRSHTTSLDRFNRAVASVLLGYALVIGLLGRKISM